MNKDSTVPTAIAFIGFIAVAIFCFIVVRNSIISKQELKYEEEKNLVGELSNLSVNINGVNYEAVSESNKAAESFIKNLPLTIEMNDINENEKRGYTYFKMTTEAKKQSKIEIGDILLSGDSYVVIATKTFKSNDKYTKIAHIQNVNEIPKGNIKAIIQKID